MADDGASAIGNKEFAMNANVGTIDRAARILIGAALIAASLGHLAGPWGWIGVVPLATGAVRFCPLYRLLGFSTCSSAHR